MPLFSFGVFADVQYADKKHRGSRFFRRSIKKLKKCVKFLNSRSLDFVVNLGDLIDGEESNFSPVLSICEEINAPLHHILGNHDYNISDRVKQRIFQIFSMESSYHSFKLRNWRIILLDGNEISFYAHPKESEQYQQVVKYHEKNIITKPDWDAAIGSKQLKWLKEELTHSKNEGEDVLLFCHFPTFPDNKHTLWNAKKVFSLLDRFPCVKCYFAGHKHTGGYARTKNAHYLTFKSMVDWWRNSFAIVKVFPEKIKVEGFGKEKNRILKIT